MSDTAQPPSRLRVWILAARPRTLGASVGPVLMGTAIAAEAGGFHPPAAALALLGALLIQIGTNLANDYFDWKKGADAGQRIGPLRVTQAGLVSPSAMRRATAGVFGLAALVGAWLVWRGGWPILAVGVASIASGVLYTAGPRPLAYVGLGELFALVFFGPVAVAGTVWVQALRIEGEAVILGLAPGLFSVAILTVNNLRDAETDRRAGKMTLAVRLGRTAMRIQYSAAILAACLVPCGLWLATGRHPASMAVLAVLPLATRTLRTVWTRTEGPALNGALVGTARLLLVFAAIFSAGWLQ